MIANAKPFQILDHLDKLNVLKGESSQLVCECPYCHGDRLTIKKSTGEYTCWHGCERRDIRQAIKPWAEVEQERNTAENQERFSQQSKTIRPKTERIWTYTDRDGSSLIRTRRIDDGKGKRKIWQEYLVDAEWLPGSQADEATKTAAKRAVMPYRYSECKPAIANNELIFWVEGEPCVDALLKLGLTSTTTIGGSDGYHSYGDYSQAFQGARLVLCPDRDQVGIKYIETVAQDYPEAQWCYPFPESEMWQQLPKKGGLDIADWIKEGAKAEDILKAIGSKRVILSLTSQGEFEAEAVEDPKKLTITKMLLAITSDATLFHSPDHTAYADIYIEGHRETHPLRSKGFKLWLTRELFTRYQKTAGSETLQSVLNTLEGQALFAGEEKPVYLRLAEYQEPGATEKQGKIYLDLGDPEWKAVEISADGWQIILEPPVRFRRPKHLLPLPIPQQGRNLLELRRVLNVIDEDWLLIACWLTFAFYPNHPHPVLILHGEQGSGKSYTARILKELIDPGKSPLVPKVADLRDLSITANNRWVLCFDNLSSVSAEASDALCRIATGGGFATRTLYENDEETVFEFIRPQILTGIDSLATRGDLLERSILINLPTIPEDQRLTEDEFQETLENIKPGVFGALLTAACEGMKRLPDVRPRRLPRMADFAKWAIAVELALGFEPGSFMATYTGNRQTAHETALESSPVAMAIQRLMENQDFWQGTASELLTEPEKLTDEKTTKSRYWAGNPRSLGKALTRLAPDLRGVGIEVTDGRTQTKRYYRLEKVEKQTSSTSPMSSETQNHKGVSVSGGDISRDKSDKKTSEMSSNVTQTSPEEIIIQQDFQSMDDISDKSDKKIPASSSSLKVGGQVSVTTPWGGSRVATVLAVKSNINWFNPFTDGRSVTTVYTVSYGLDENGYEAEDIGAEYVKPYVQQTGDRTSIVPQQLQSAALASLEPHKPQPRVDVQAELDLNAAEHKSSYSAGLVEVWVGGEWVSAHLLQAPNNHPDPRQRISGWKVRILETGLERYFWSANEIRSAGSGT